MTAALEAFSVLGVEVIEGMGYAQTIAAHGPDVLNDEHACFLALLRRESDADLSDVVAVESDCLCELDTPGMWHVMGVVARKSDGSIATQAIVLIDGREFEIFVRDESDELAECLLEFHVDHHGTDFGVIQNEDGSLDLWADRWRSSRWEVRNVAPNLLAIACAISSYSKTLDND